MVLRQTALIVMVIFVAVSISACAQGDYRDRYRDRDVDVERDSRYQDSNYDYLVEIYEHSDYRGRSQAYELMRDQRHVLVEFVGWDMNDRISSIRIGRGVGIALFRDRDFKGPVAIYEYDVPMLDHDINDWASSAIIFDRQLGGPLGVWLGERDDPDKIFSTSFNGQVRFFPLSEGIDDLETRFYRVDEFNDNVEWVVLGPASRDMFRRGGSSGYQPRYGERRGRGSEIEVVLYEHGDMRGRSLMLPTRFGSGQTAIMADHDFNRIVSSMVIREIRPRW